LGLVAAIADELRDCDYGSWAGVELSEVQMREPNDVATWLAEVASAPHGGESIFDLAGRVGRWMEGQSTAGHAVVVTHPAVIRAAVLHALGAPLQAFWRIDIAPLTLTDLRFNGEAWTVRCLNCELRGPGLS
jgi:broad specificity phosphatase PhoE